jgi:F-type H+-transporting ATPase subunit alpha
MRQVAGTLRLDLAQFRELAAFAQFGSDLDKATLNQLNRGRRLVEVLKQPQYQPLPVEKQVIVIYAATNGYLDPIPVEQVRAYETELFQFLDTRQTGLVAALTEKKAIDDQIKADLNKALEEFGKGFAASGRTAAA